MARRPRTSTPAAWLAGVLVSVLAVGVIVLSAFAVFHGRDAVASDQTAQPVPTFTRGPAPTATPTPTPTAKAAAAPGAAERFLSMGDGVMWRATAGACGGALPLLERSTDNGATWSDVTPIYRGIGRIDRLDPLAGVQAEMVAGVGAGCPTQAMRTFTSGQFWDFYPDVLAASSYIDGAHPGTIVTPTGPITAPCPTAYGLRGSASSTLAIICNGHAYTLSSSKAWTDLGLSNAVAAAVSDDEIIVAHTATDCAGVKVSAVRVGTSAPTSVGCLAGASPSAPLALAADGANTIAWTGASVVVVK
ncbi:hypothetical protein ABCS02_22170 [Microbacterium sp. X-17]|uniref:hypothetical protein n=1 Tax=Microbacterium sp. X-17 TaxID=3144404 RepID=UPI0031F4E4AB